MELGREPLERFPRQVREFGPGTSVDLPGEGVRLRLDRIAQVVGEVGPSRRDWPLSRPDEEIALDIHDDVLLGTFWVTPGDVDVTVRNGEVSLGGTVESDLLTQLLPEAVQRVPGVVGVKSRIVARPGDATPADVGLFRRI